MRQHGSARSGALFGAILVVVGSILLLERMDALPTNLIRHFWPIMWLVIGVGLLTSNRGMFGKASGVVMIVLSAAMEAEKQGWLRLRFRDLWPLWLIAMGALMLWRALRPPDPAKASRDLSASRVSEYAIFGGHDVRVSSDSFEGGNFTAMFGGHEVDFAGSRIRNSPAVLFCDAICGGISLRVPRTWRVTVNGPAIMGGFDNKALPPEPGDGTEQHLVIKGFAMMGGIEIKNVRDDGRNRD